MDQTRTAEDWEQIQKLFPARHAITRSSWAYSISQRLGRKRIGRLLNVKGAKPLETLLSERSPTRIKALRTYAAINLEQASAAFRITVVMNVSFPVVFITILNQIFPGTLSDVFTIGFTVGGHVGWVYLLILSLCALALIWIMMFALMCLAQARDIRHLIDLYAAERGIFFGLKDSQEMQSG